MGLNEIAQVIHARSRRAGFYEDDKVRPLDGMFMNIVTEVAEAQEEWRNGRQPAETYWSIVTKEYGALECLRMQEGRLQVRADSLSHIYDDSEEWLYLTPEMVEENPWLRRGLKPEGIPIELADVIIRALDICAWAGIDIEAAIKAKMSYNDTRPHRHGGKLS